MPNPNITAMSTPSEPANPAATNAELQIAIVTSVIRRLPNQRQAYPATGIAMTEPMPIASSTQLSSPGVASIRSTMDGSRDAHAPVTAPAAVKTSAVPSAARLSRTRSGVTTAIRQR
jgi:hypothetical protein